MPRHQEPKKDAATCDKRRGVGANDDPTVSEWGNPLEVMLEHPWLNT
jgi:hypothetical protein